ncbi:MAG: TRAP transporter substrate-binding protein [Pseudomonadota bacterium]
MIEISFAGYQGDKSVHTRGGRVLAEAVARETDGAARLNFEESIIPRGKKAADLLSMTETGELDGCYFSSSYLAKRVPALGLFDQHFVVPDRRRAYGVLDGQLGARLAAQVEAATGYKVMGYWDNGLRHISSRTPIRTPADCVGKAIRTLANEGHQRVFRALGFEPKTIDVRDLPDAVRSGTVDAQENPLTNIFNFGIYDVHRHITLTRHLLGVAMVLFNKGAAARWPGTVRAGVERAVAEATLAQRRFAEEDDTICADALRKEGVEIIELSDAQRDAFARSTRAEVDVTRQAFDHELLVLFQSDLDRA